MAEELEYFAATTGCPHLTPIIDRLRRPLRVAVVGRVGVGRRTVAAALGQRGVAVLPTGVDDGAAEVCVLVIAEALKPEDRLALSPLRPMVIALAKADLAGPDPGGPMAVARRRAATIAAATGTPTVPMMGLLAALDGPLDDGLVAALRSFVTEPANLASVDTFLDRPHSVERDVRARLLMRLDRFGIAHGVLALARGCDPRDLTAHLRGLGNADEVMSAVDVAAAQPRYLRIRAARAELRALGHRVDDDRLSELAAADPVVLAAMTASVEVLEAAGLEVDRGDTRAAHVDRAVHWRRYGRGPVNALHRRCGEDVVTGSLRLLAEPSR